MSQETIGKFIATCRKEKNLTQVQVADALGITNRAVSKWETGKSVPDVSIMIELCEMLGISVNELLCGRHLDSEEEKMANDNNVVKVTIAKKKIGNLRIATECLVLSGIIIGTTFAKVMAHTKAQIIAAIVIGAFVSGYGMWMRVKLRKICNDMEE